MKKFYLLSLTLHSLLTFGIKQTQNFWSFKYQIYLAYWELATCFKKNFKSIIRDTQKLNISEFFKYITIGSSQY